MDLEQARALYLGKVIRATGPLNASDTIASFVGICDYAYLSSRRSISIHATSLTGSGFSADFDRDTVEVYGD